jgi:hypothetical protein
VRRPLVWILVAAAVVTVVVVAVALLGDDDGSGQTVTAAEWAQNACTAVGVWRGQMDAIAADVGTPTDASAVRSGLERALVETERVVDAIDAPGVPDTENGDEAVEQVTSWANGAINDLNQAQGALNAESGGDTLEELRLAAGAIEGVVESGRQVLADIATTDPELAEAFRDSDTCQQAQVGASG